MAIELRQLRRTYRMGDEEVTALTGLDLTISQGEFLTILGPSGSGKTTLLHLIGGLDRPTSGEIRVGDLQLRTSSSDALAEYRRRRIGVVFQSYHLIGHLTALENVEQAMALSGVPASERRERAEALLQSVGMGDRLRHRPSQLSGGQQQRVSIARALANDPEILLCDEPTGNLDTHSGQQVMDILHRLCREGGKTLILITHNPELSEGADRVLELRDGELVELRGTPPTDAVAPATHAAGSLAWRDVFGYAGRNISRVKARAVLTGLGVAIGVGAIVLMVSFGQGLQDSVLGQLNGLASLTQIQVSPSKSTSGLSNGLSLAGTGPSRPINDTTLRTLARLPHVQGAWYQESLLGQAKLGRRSATVLATNLAPHRFILPAFSNQIVAGGLPGGGQAQTVLLASQSAQYLVRQGSRATTADLRHLIGQTVQVSFTNDLGTTGIGGTSFNRPVVRSLRVVAILKGSTSYVPYPITGAVVKQGRGITTTNASTFLYSSAMVQVDRQPNVASVAQQIGRMGYGTQTFADFIKQLSQVFLIVQSILGVIGGIALVVAGLGIANVMVVAVLERTREIGVLKAIGARRRDIRRLFLAEALMIGLGGGIIGLGLGYLGGIVINAIVDLVIRRQGGSGVHLFAVTPWVAVGAVVFALLAALLSGIYPANKAAGLNPVTALRHD